MTDSGSETAEPDSESAAGAGAGTGAGAGAERKKGLFWGVLFFAGVVVGVVEGLDLIRVD